MMPVANRIYNTYIVLLIIGFFAIGLLSNVVEGGSRAVTIPFRAGMLIFSLYIIIIGLTKSRTIIPAKHLLFFFLFWLFYTIRIVVDLYFRNIQATVFGNNIDYILNAVGICFLPSAALLFLKEDVVDINWILKWFYRVLFAALIVSLFINLEINADESQQSYGRYGGGGSLNTISYGHQGVSLSLLSLFLLSRSKKNIITTLIYLTSFILGLFVMYLAGSKGPLVALVICCIFFYFTTKGIFKGLIILISIALPFFIFSSQIQDYLSSYGGAFFERILLSINQGDQERSALISEGFNDFSDSPFYGKAFVLQGIGAGNWKGFYPHNIIIESLMSLGIIGGILITGMVIRGGFNSYKILKTSDSAGWVGLLFIQYFIFALFSNSIYTNHFFWAYLVLLTVVANLQNRKPTLRQ